MQFSGLSAPNLSQKISGCCRLYCCNNKCFNLILPANSATVLDSSFKLFQGCSLSKVRQCKAPHASNTFKPPLCSCWNHLSIPAPKLFLDGLHVRSGASATFFDTVKRFVQQEVAPTSQDVRNQQMLAHAFICCPL